MTKRSPTARPHADRIPRVPVGPLAPRVLVECADWLDGLGYSPGSARGVVNLLGRLSLWMDRERAEVDDISEDLLARFLAVERSRDQFSATAVRIHPRYASAPAPSRARPFLPGP